MTRTVLISLILLIPAFLVSGCGGGEETEKFNEGTVKANSLEEAQPAKDGDKFLRFKSKS